MCFVYICVCARMCGLASVQSTRRLRSTNNLWEIELADSRDGAPIAALRSAPALLVVISSCAPRAAGDAGGPLQWGAEMRLRHANTGRYLSASRPSSTTPLRILAEARELTVSTVFHPHADCVFTFEPTTMGAVGAVPVGSGVRIQARCRCILLLGAAAAAMLLTLPRCFCRASTSAV